MQSQLPQRKYPRLKSFDYGRGGGYFLTICTHNRKRLLSTISTESQTDGTTPVGWGLAPTESQADGTTPVGWGLAPTESKTDDTIPVGWGLAPTESQTDDTIPVGWGLAPAESKTDGTTPVGWGLAPTESKTNGERTMGTEFPNVRLTRLGEIVEKQLLHVQERFKCVTVDRYVIMPNHVHVILIIDEEMRRDGAVGASPHPTVMDIICAFKSLSTRECKKIGLDGALFQRSFYDRVIRNRAEYEEICRYIYGNPLNWETDELYCEE